MLKIAVCDDDSRDLKSVADMLEWYIGATSDYAAQDSEWYHIFTLHKGDCSVSRYALMYMCKHMGIKAVACRNIDYHGQALFAENGYEGTPVRAINRKAGLADGLLYHYFSDGKKEWFFVCLGKDIKI